MGERPSQDPLSALHPGVMALVEVQGQAYLDAIVGMVRSLQGTGVDGIVINVSRPYETLSESFEREGLDLERLHFIDCISRLAQSEVEDREDVMFLDSPTMLEMIAMGVDHFLEDVDEGGFVLFDAYGSLLQYNDFELVYEFTNFLMNKLRLRRMRGLLMVMEDELSDDARSSLQQLVDTVVEWRGQDG